MFLQTSRRKLSLETPMVMAILNVTPDSFSDGGDHLSVDAALARVERFIEDGADILDIGGESTRPGSSIVPVDEELKRVVPVIEAVAGRFDIPISVDTTKSEVAQRAVDAGAEIINDISGLRFDERIAAIAATMRAGLVLMHSRGSFETLHSQPPVEDILTEVSSVLRHAIDAAKSHAVNDDQIALDIGIGFGKTQEQNLELLAKLDKLVNEFQTYPILVGTSRKSFIGKVLGGTPPSERLAGSLASAIIAVENGARIVRVHDVRPTVDALKVAKAIHDRR